jgi:hypothetical protein
MDTKRCQAFKCGSGARKRCLTRPKPPYGDKESEAILCEYHAANGDERFTVVREIELIRIGACARCGNSLWRDANGKLIDVNGEHYCYPTKGTGPDSPQHTLEVRA